MRFSNHAEAIAFDGSFDLRDHLTKKPGSPLAHFHSDNFTPFGTAQNEISAPGRRQPSIGNMPHCARQPANPLRQAAFAARPNLVEVLPRSVAYSASGPT